MPVKITVHFRSTMGIVLFLKVQVSGEKAILLMPTWRERCHLDEE